MSYTAVGSLQNFLFLTALISTVAAIWTSATFVYFCRLCLEAYAENRLHDKIHLQM